MYVCIYIYIYIYMRAVPMGWLGAVDVMQSMARRPVFDTRGVLTGAELRKDRAPRARHCRRLHGWL